ncbi:hypothetical protein ACNKHW_03285 [Shigella flexneri]
MGLLAITVLRASAMAVVGPIALFGRRRPAWRAGW